jgi:hypothetical protein
MALVEAGRERLSFKKVFTDKSFHVKDAEFDNFVYVGHMRSVDELFWKFKQEGGVEVYRVGDAKAPACVEISIHEAELLARAI